MTRLSVAIVTFNEEKNIRRCLKSASWADELVVVDGRSTDQTAAIARKQGARVYSVENQAIMKIMMNQAFKKCTGDWILSLDADETISPELRGEIVETVSKDSSYSAYRLPRKNVIFGKWIEHSFWYPDLQLRLFRRGKAEFPAENVHEELRVEGSIGELKNPLEHLNYETVTQFIQKLDKYSTVEAEKLLVEGRKIVWQDAVRFPLLEFLTRFFAKQGYRDGLHGLVLALLQAFYWEAVFAKVWEKQGFWQYGDQRFLEEVEEEGREVSRHWRHWLTVSTPDPFKKLVSKASNKIRTIIQNV